MPANITRLNASENLEGCIAHEKALAALLRAAGIVLLTAVIPAAMPFHWMQEIHRGLGMGELPSHPIIGYLTRSLSLMYALHGALVFFVSLHVRRFLPIARFLAIIGMAFGGSMIALDVAVGMPAYWVICEGPFIILLSLVILLFTKEAPRQNGKAALGPGATSR